MAIVTTEGFRDVYLLGRTSRDPLYDLKYTKPASLVLRRHIFEVAGRIEAAGIEAVAVCFLHSYANPAHELAMAEVLAEHCPGVSVTLSHALTREYRECERSSTAVIGAYVKPVTRGYPGRVERSADQAPSGCVPT